MKFLDVICLAVLCGILTLGLWPFHAPVNEVTWPGNQNGLRFGRHGTVLSSSALTVAGAPNESSGSIEIWLQPRSIWDSGTFFAFYAPADPFRLALRQWQTDLALRTANRDDSQPSGTTALFKSVFRKRGPVFLTITSGRGETAIYVDGVVAEESPQLRLSSKKLTGRLVVGDSPRQGDSWPGQLLGLAIYHRELSAPEVREHYESWARKGRPALRGDERNVVLYLFDERGGKVVHDHASSGVDLCIPEKYLVLDQVLLESPWSEFNRPGNFWGAVLKNIVGFIPFGWCFYVYFYAAHPVKHAVWVTATLGTLVSLTIEILQAYLPTRTSGVMDLITNTLGTYVGVILCKVLSSILAARFPWLPLVASARR